MKGFDHVHADEGFARRRFGGTDEDAAAPQGQALILELQRLRQAFELDNRQDQRPPLRRPANDEGRPGSRRPRQARPKRSKKKSKMGRVLDWLGPFGSPARSTRSRAPAAARRPQHARAAVHAPAAGGRHARPGRPSLSTHVAARMSGRRAVRSSRPTIRR